MRQIVLDTETTGLEPAQGHRVIEIGCVEIVNRRLTGRHYHQYIKPNRESDEGALAVHGITTEFLSDKPEFSQIVDEFMAFIDGAELVIHNAPFDLGFLNHELKLNKTIYSDIASYCQIIDSLVMAREMHPGQRNSLDALCKRYAVDNSQRDLHGALLDAEILADVYLLMTGGQTDLSLGGASSKSSGSNQVENLLDTIRRLPEGRSSLPIIKATEDELLAHQSKLEELDQSSGGDSVWSRLLNERSGQSE